ncbi:MAG: aldo/keto reductase [Deltaproteobacteria bacterium]|nr:aldo/keto reductase [Deltaproteobacteria bacterium]
MSDTPIKKRSFGDSDRKITIVGLGGEGVLRSFGKEKKAQEVIETALDLGISYFDSARAYSGSEAYYGLVWTRRPQDRARIFQTSKTGLRTKKEALRELDRTLLNLGTDNLDLWQIHDLRTEEDFQTIAGPGGALEAFIEAKARGKIRFIGLTGHYDPEIMTRAVKAWPIDSVLIPVNPIEGNLGGFLTSTLAAARAKGVAVIGMKVLGGSHYLIPGTGITAELLIRFALSQPITLVIVDSEPRAVLRWFKLQPRSLITRS